LIELINQVSNFNISTFQHFKEEGEEERKRRGRGEEEDLAEWARQWPRLCGVPLMEFKAQQINILYNPA
tara:strand:- start:38 stop:244 length:207 start_codon:yes stop_codon:yes gene_type:complete